MSHYKRHAGVIIGLLGLAILAFPAIAAEQPWTTRSNENAKLLLDVMARYAPERASGLGVDGHDERITDLATDQFAAQSRDTRAVIARLTRRLAGERDPKVRQDLEILIKAANDQLRTNTLNRQYFLPYFNVGQLLYGVVHDTLDPRVAPERRQKIVARLEKYAGLTKGYRPISELAIERFRARLASDNKLLGPYKGEVEQALNDGPVLLQGIKDLLIKYEVSGWEPAYAALAQQLATYDIQLRKQILPFARSDHRLPPEVYADRLRQAGVDIPPRELVARALTAFAEIRNQLVITAGLVAREQNLPDADYRAVIRELKKQQIAPELALPLYVERLAQLEAAVRAHQIVSLPERKALIRIASSAENARQPAPHMNEPRLIGNTGEYGEFVLTTGLPPDASGKRLVFDDFTHQAGSWTLTAHEARPGHELQFAKMLEIGVSTARAVFAFNSVNAEGWALYAEAEMQPFEPLDGQLFALQARMQRAARAFLDPMVNLGEISADSVKHFLMDEVGLSEAMATQEMQRYTFRDPGQATSYFYGYQRLMETRQAAEVALRQKINRRAFNDFVLAQGLIPPALLRKAVLEEFVPSSQ
ncbi:MAG TPA: DUF885 domain-containing protein [Duganella sp.]|nr:DUF885 domain-containing protein [Duganella sp.]